MAMLYNLGPCSRCGEELSNAPHWTSLKLHKHCLEANERDLRRNADEPRRLNQTVMGETGNCQSACIAMLLGFDFSDSVPNFALLAKEKGNAEAYRAQDEFLNARGWGIVTIVKWQALPWPPKSGWYIAGGVSPRGLRHAVLYHNGELWHDPHPSHEGIAEVQDIDIIYPLFPWRTK